MVSSQRYCPNARVNRHPLHDAELILGVFSEIQNQIVSSILNTIGYVPSLFLYPSLALSTPPPPSLSLSLSLSHTHTHTHTITTNKQTKRRAINNDFVNGFANLNRLNIPNKWRSEWMNERRNADPAAMLQRVWKLQFQAPLRAPLPEHSQRAWVTSVVAIYVDKRGQRSHINPLKSLGCGESGVQNGSTNWPHWRRVACWRSTRVNDQSRQKKKNPVGTFTFRSNKRVIAGDGDKWKKKGRECTQQCLNDRDCMFSHSNHRFG